MRLSTAIQMQSMTCQIKGFINIPNSQNENTCYANSLLQIILNQSYLTDICLQTFLSQDLPSHENALLQLIRSYQYSANHYLLSSYQFKSSIDARLGTPQQQDVQEFFTEVCNKFENIFTPCFNFTIQTERKCLNSNCKLNYYSKLPQTASTTPIVIENKPYNFEDILTNYSKWNSTVIECNNYKSNVQEKNTLDLSTNKYLVLQFSLFNFNRLTQTFWKNTNFSVNNIANNTLNYNGNIYRAIGGIFHEGISLDHGHYKAIVLRNNNWYFVEDARIQKENWTTSNITNLMNSNLYLLFLEKK